MKKAIVTAAANSKGGTTKTTTAFNLACCAVEAGKNVLVIDFDKQGSLSSISGIYNNTDLNINERSSALIPGIRQPDGTLKTALPSELAIPTKHGFDIVPATYHLYPGTEDVIKETPFGDGLIYRQFAKDEAMFEKYDLVICDTEGSISRLAKSVLIAAGNYYIPNLPAEGSVEQLDMILQTVRTVNDQLVDMMGMPPIAFRGHFFSQFKERERASQYQEEEALAFLGASHLSDFFIPFSTEFEQAAIMKMPITTYSAKSKGAVAYRRLFARLFPELSNEC